MNWKHTLAAVLTIALASCTRDHFPVINEDPATFTEIATLDVGELGAAEITAFDPLTNKLFIVTNSGGTTRIDIADLTNPSTPSLIGSIDISPYGGGVNSIAIYDGKLAAAVEGFSKTDPGKVVVFKTSDYSLIKQVSVGALPDMITYTYDGKFILTADEGEPNDAYTIDPVGTVSIVSVQQNYSVIKLDFSSFASQESFLKSKGLRKFGPNASFAQDMEPEYLTISQDSKTAWVTLQENNCIAKIDIKSGRITNMFPLGFKNYNTDANAIDVSDRDGGILPSKWNIKGMYQPDAIAVYEELGTPYLFTANEGDVREWSGYAENKRIKDLNLDASTFPDAAILKTDAKLGRLNSTIVNGDTDGDGDYDELYSFGARSFSVWNGNNGSLVFDSKNELEQKCIAANFYDDTRSDDKGVEPEGITLGLVGTKKLAFIGMERADAIAIYDISNPSSPKFIKLLHTGDAPEGLTFIPANLSPINKSLLVASGEGDGTIKIYKTN